MRNILLFLILVISTSFVQAQENDLILSYSEYIEIVKKQHPIAYQSELQIEMGEAYLQKARGAFDPKLEADLDQKYFNEKNYYSHFNSKLKIPTWYGMTVLAGYENNEGAYINPEIATPTNGLIQAGIAVTVGKGLFIDERRAELKQAKIYVNGSFLEQQMMLNQLILNASNAYWKWKSAFLKLEVYKNAITNAELRYQSILENIKIGEQPGIDSVEAKIVIQNRKISYFDSEMEYQYARQKLNVYLWQEGLIPLELDPSVNPEVEMTIKIERVLLNDSLVENHPEILLYDIKRESQQIDYQLKKEALKPSLDLKYQFLNEPVGNSAFQMPNLNNYKWGASLSYPILLRKERADIKLAEIKMKGISANQELKKASIINDTKALNTAIESLTYQFDLSKQVVKNYQIMFDSETTLFNIGESSVFMINSREKSLIDSQLKTIELYYKLLMTEQEYRAKLFLQ